MLTTRFRESDAIELSSIASLSTRRTILYQGRGQGQREWPSVDEAEGSIIVPPPASSDRPAGGAHAASSCAPAVTLETVLANLYELSGEHIDADAPLLESGLDSVGAVELGNQLQQQTGEGLPATLIVEHPTRPASSQTTLCEHPHAVPCMLVCLCNSPLCCTRMPMRLTKELLVACI